MPFDVLLGSTMCGGRQVVIAESFYGDEAVVADWIAPVDPHAQDVGRALEHIVLTLPPKERACVLLKDVFDYSLEEIAEMVGSTVGGVKAALNRGRSKLTKPRASVGTRAMGIADQATRLRDLYIERFNRKDWDGVRELITADARLVVADRFAGSVEGAPYFGRYDRLTRPWRLASGEVDGERVLIVLERGADVWMPQAIVRFRLSDREIVSITDYTHCPWVLSAATVVHVDSPPDTRIQSAS
jgi:RNA polymerase sigma-70 factor, ECF subfamily